jgi:serine/threonine protein kinase
VTQASKALKYLHNVHIVHGDVKPVRRFQPESSTHTSQKTHFLYDFQRKRVLLCDFSHAQRPDTPENRASQVVTIRYCAPELFTCSTDFVKTTKSDMYSFAMTAYHVRNPFPSPKFIDSLTDPQRPPAIPHDISVRYSTSSTHQCSPGE